MKETAILLFSCPDRKGIVAKVSNFIFRNGGNIIHSDEHRDHELNIFFMRVEWSLDGFRIPKSELPKSIRRLSSELDADYQLYFSSQKPRVAIFVSKLLHCLYDLLARYQAGEYRCEIPLIISNHMDAEPVAKHFGVKFHHFPITKENRLEQERRELEVLKREKIEAIVLARYDRILSPQMVQAYRNRIISVHHSFLPAFVGRDAYEQAYRRGVKIVGATAYFVTEELDAGPIIEQDVVPVSHRDSLEDFKRKGEDAEKLVLNRALKWYVERKILVYDNKTVIFD
ncbi:MAG: formyltetrahydrofolate deformylase [Candidatus Hadarchaeales archaeon]